jgi:hypothetical protein
VDSCLFAGDVQSTYGFNMTGVQVSFTSTWISFDLASLLSTCGGVKQTVTPAPPPLATTTRRPTMTDTVVGLLAGGGVIVIGLAAVLVFLAVRCRRTKPAKGQVLVESTEEGAGPALMDGKESI